MSTRARVILLTWLMLPSVALANPMPVENGPFIGLFGEAVVIALILGIRGFDPIRFFYSWVVVTLTTFVLLVSGHYAFGRLDEATRIIPSGSGVFLFLLAEAGIVLVEAIVLQRMTRLSFFQRKKTVPLGFTQALSYSLIANAVSFLLGLSIVEPVI
jgi:hypothetical protein